MGYVIGMSWKKNGANMKIDSAEMYFNIYLIGFIIAMLISMLIFIFLDVKEIKRDLKVCFAIEEVKEDG